uniref:uncharacterized protein proca1 n=1 Tax=Solea senegalensis TaxID=28829 RepID=UPI001CD82187|nr:uncharacterized protein proca1 [Solea senegalensis]
MWCVLFVFLSYLDRNLVKGHFVDAEVQSRDMLSARGGGGGTWCAKVPAVARENSLYQVSDGAEVVSSVLSPSGVLVDCSVSVNHTEVKAFMNECRLELELEEVVVEEEEEVARFTRMNEAKRMCRELHERKQESGDEDKVLKRSRRGFTYPGTLWCGAGNMADHYEQLGDFAGTDSCCRTHDHCPHVIHAFSSKYGYANFKWHSICHCDCDTELKSCLRKVNDTSSRVVGQAFFNVIGVPCFELIYEEQCAERHWYGLCKRYEKLPIAVMKEPVPYDYGGIDVIDELTLAPPTKKSKEEEEEKPESTTQSTVSGHEEPSLTNVVTAAEDFIKVLATVSTSQSSSSADSDKGEAQGSEKKKKKKNTGGNKKKKQKKKTKKQKGKGRKRKQKPEVGSKTEEGAAVSPTGGKTGEVIALSNFINESHRHDQSSRNENRVADSEYELRGKDEPYNEVMKDEPADDKDTAPVTSPVIVQTKPTVTDTDAPTEETTPSTSTNMAMVPLKGQIKEGPRKGRRKKHEKVPVLSPDGLVTNTTDNSGGTPAPTVVTITTTTQPEQQSLEKGPVSAGILKVKRNRSKERGGREGRKKRRRGGTIVAASPEHSSADDLKVIPLHGAPDVTPVSHRLDAHATALNSSFSVLERPKERGVKRRKTKVPPSEESYDNIAPFIETTPDSSGGPNVNATSAAISHLPFITVHPTVHVKRHRHTFRQQRKSKKKVASAAAAAPVNNGASVLAQTECTPLTFTDAQSKVTAAEELGPRRFETTARWTTSASPDMSPIQLSIERVKAQFNRKKRRKAAMFFRQQ